MLSQSVSYFVLAIVIFEYCFVTPVRALHINEQSNTIKGSPISSFQNMVIILFYNYLYYCA